MVLSVLDLKVSDSYKNPAVPFDVTEKHLEKDWSWLIMLTQFYHMENKTTRAETPIFTEGN